MELPNSVIIDFETMGNRNTSIVLDLAVVVFREDRVDRFEDMIADQSRLFHVKFDIGQQQAEKRTVDKSTYEWWMQQSSEVQSIIKPSKIDKRIDDALRSLNEFLESHNICLKNSLAYSRGTSFDFPIMDNIAISVDHFGKGSGMWPCAFWNQRDVRTAIAYAMLQPHLKKLPVAKGTFKGFVKHNSIHDVCKDAILLQTALAYGRGELELPDIDSDSVEFV